MQPVVGGVVVVRWRMSYEADPGLLPGASSSPGLGPAGGPEGPREQAGGCAPQGSGGLLRATHWPGPGGEAAVNLFLIPVSATYWTICLGQSVGPATHPAPPFGQPEESQGQLGPGCLAASAMTAGQGLGIRPRGSCQLRSASS